jgi:hypothetical protein
MHLRDLLAANFTPVQMAIPSPPSASSHNLGNFTILALLYRDDDTSYHDITTGDYIHDQ